MINNLLPQTHHLNQAPPKVPRCNRAIGVPAVFARDGFDVCRAGELLKAIELSNGLANAKIAYG